MACSLLATAGPVAARRRLPLYQLQEVHGEVGFNVGHDKDVREATGRPDVDESEVLLQQELEIGGGGWLYHPALTDIDADFGLLFNQDFLSSKTGRSAETFADQFNYNVRLGLLPYKPYPISGMVSQLRSEINSPFTPRRIIDTFRYGADFSLRGLDVGGVRIPTRALYRHQETETSSFSGGTDSTRVGDDAELSARAETENTDNRVRYNWKSLETRSRGRATASTRHDVRAYQERHFDSGALASQVSMTDYRDDFQMFGLTLNENLNLRHGRSFASSWGYGLSHQDSPRSNQLAHAGQIGLTHRLYESLTTGVRGSGTYSRSELGRIWSSGLGGQAMYRKRVPGGTLGLRFMPSYLYTDEDVKAGVRSVIDENHDVVVGPLIVLERPFVIPSSIVVRDPVTLRVFIEGIDYQIIALGIQTGIQVIPGSDLDPAVSPDTPVIVVSYDHVTEPARTFDTLILGSGASLDLWDHLSLDVDHTKAEQDLIKGNLEQFTLDDSQRLLARAVLRFEHNRTRFEYERYRSRITPRRRYTVTHDLTLRPTERSTLGVGAAYDNDLFTDTDRLAQTVSLHANGTVMLPYAVLMRMGFLVRWTDQEEQWTFGTGGSLALSYQYGRIRFEADDRLSWRSTDAKDLAARQIRELTNTVFFRIVRPF